jgi:hypothetical protein
MPVLKHNKLVIYTGITLSFPGFNSKIKAFGTIWEIFRAIGRYRNRGALKSTGNTFLTGRKTKNSCRKNDKK